MKTVGVFIMDGTLKVGEAHPAAQSAYDYAKLKLLTDPIVVEAIASTALSGNRPAEICHETARRVLAGEPVSDRYVLGLAWFLLELENDS